MPSLTEDEISILQIRDFIFHVVHHGDDQPVLFDETPIGAFEKFFLERIRDTLKGNRFIFLEGSVTAAALNEIQTDGSKFVDISKTLARAFHTRGDRRIKLGVLILIRLSAGPRILFSIIKYDHETTLSYDVAQNSSAVLKEIANSFTKSKEAMQKSALIELNENGGDLVVIDRKVAADISEFFRGFLTVRRAYDQDELTGALEKVIRATVKAHRDDLPAEIVSKVRERLYNTVQKREDFEEDQFFSEFFGADGSDEIKKTYQKLLKTNNIDGEIFKLSKAVIAKPRPTKYSTAEGVNLDIQERAQATVDIHYNVDGGAVIKITTARLYER